MIYRFDYNYYRCRYSIVILCIVNRVGNILTKKKNYKIHQFKHYTTRPLIFARASCIRVVHLLI